MFLRTIEEKLQILNQCLSQHGGWELPDGKVYLNGTDSEVFLTLSYKIGVVDPYKLMPKRNQKAEELNCVVYEVSQLAYEDLGATGYKDGQFIVEPPETEARKPTGQINEVGEKVDAVFISTVDDEKKSHEFWAPLIEGDGRMLAPLDKHSPSRWIEKESKEEALQTARKFRDKLKEMES